MSESLAAFYARERDLELSRRARRREQQKAHQRSAQARRAGIASGVVRRALARGRRVPHARDRTAALALVYPIRQVTREEHQRRYRDWCEREGRCFNEAGWETNWQLYLGYMRRYRYSGQDFETTNAQQARGLAHRGRPRCTRTVQRQRQVLVEMGLIRFSHVRRRGAELGHRDSLRVCLMPVRRRQLMSPSLREQEEGDPSGLYPPPAQTTQHLIAPPHGGRDGPPAAPAGNGSDEESAPAQLAFADAWAAQLLERWQRQRR